MFCQCLCIKAAARRVSCGFMAEEKKADSNDEQLIPGIARWDISINPESFNYHSNQRGVTRIASFADKHYLNCRTVFFEEGRHIFNIKITNGSEANCGIGICSRRYKLASGNWIGKTAESYGTWSDNTTVAYHNNSKLTNDIIQDVKVNTGDIIKLDLNLNKRTFLWEIRGQTLTKSIRISFEGDVAVCFGSRGTNDAAEIVQYFRM